MQSFKIYIRKLLENIDCCKSSHRALSQYNLATEALELTKEKPLENPQNLSENETNDRVIKTPIHDKTADDKSYWTEDKTAAALWDICEIGLYEDAKKILDSSLKNLELNTLNNEGYNILHQSIRMHNTEIIKLLLQYSPTININCQDRSKKTPLHLATIENNVEVVRVLIEAGALLNLQDEDQNTALHYAIIQENPEIVEMIVLNCPNMHVRNKDGFTAMDLIQQKKVEVVSDPSEIFTISEFEEVEVNVSIPEGVCRPDHPVSLKDFNVVQLIGRGSFGEVFLVRQKFSGELFAMKVLKKEKIFAQNLQKYVLAERNILSYINHPFIVSLKFAFQDRLKVFLILEYCGGGNLSACIKRFGTLNETTARVYLCEILLALAELHRRGIIYRDLKPDNVVLDSNGHALLTDFGLSKEGVMDNVSATSFCGSVAYLAPEMIRRQGHGKPVDWYLFGVVMYEMLTGKPPYYNTDRQLLLYNIENAKLKIPSRVSDGARDLLKNLLKRDPLKRLGTVGDAEEVKSHEFFEGVDWTKVYNKELALPVPPLNSIRSEYTSPYNTQGDEYFETENRISGWTFVADN